MTIAVNCLCGRSFVVKDEFAGRQGRCQACGRTVTIRATPARHYDVFISYTQVDRATAESIRKTLEAHGLRCWIAPRDIVPGKPWGEAIIDGIDASNVMVLVFSSGANRSPQVSREVERAVSKGLVIIPFRIENVPYSKSLEYFLSTPHWLDAFQPPLELHLRRLVGSIRTVQKRATKARSVPPPLPSIVTIQTWTSLLASRRVVLACAAILVLMIPLLAWKLVASRSAGGPTSVLPTLVSLTQQGGVGELSLPSGKLLFRTERFEPPAQPNDQVTRIATAAQVKPELLELAFQLQNVSEESVTLASIRMISFGRLTIWEDEDKDNDHFSARLMRDAEKNSLEPPRTVLGNLFFGNDDPSKTGNRSSGNLLAVDESAVIPPHSTRSFLVKVAVEKLTPKLRDLEANGMREFHVSRINRSLEALDENVPHSHEMAYNFAVVVEVLWKGSDRTRLYSDGIYAVDPVPIRDSAKLLKRELFTSASNEPIEYLVSRAPLEKWQIDKPTAFIRRLIENGVKLNHETLVYELAQKLEILPRPATAPMAAGLGADDVTEYCFFHDKESPYRKLVIESEKKDSIKLIIAEPYMKYPRQRRSNLIDMLAAVRSNHASLWDVLEREVANLEMDKNPALRKKATFVKQKLKERNSSVD